MATKDLIIKVWIEEGCIVCDACETAAPDVFEVLEETCIVRPAALDIEFTKPRTDGIVEAAEECPVDVIKFDTVPGEAVPGEVPEGESAPGDAATEKAAPAAPAETKAEAQAAPSTAAAAAGASAPTPNADKTPARPEPVVATAEDTSDPGIQALLRAAASRGGNAGLQRSAEERPKNVQAWDRKNPSDLPPDARQAKVFEQAKKSSKDPDSKRRKLIGSTALTVGWVAFGTGTGVAIGPAMGRFMMPNVLEEPDPRVRVGKIQRYVEMEPGAVNEDYKTQGIWMIREEGRFAALNIICTHLGCIPNWLPNDRKFKCPCHGSGYKPNGINFEGPTPRPLERFRVSLEDGIVVVDKSKKYQYELGQWDMPGSYMEV